MQLIATYHLHFRDCHHLGAVFGRLESLVAAFSEVIIAKLPRRHHLSPFLVEVTDDGSAVVFEATVTAGEVFAIQY